MSESIFVCSLCSTRSTSISLWLSHLRNVHESETEISVSCPIDRCCAVYNNVNSLYSHVYRKHRDLLSIPPGSRSSTAPISTSLDNMLDTDNMLESHTDTFSCISINSLDISALDGLTHDINQLLNRDAHEMKKKSTLFLMKLKEERLLTQAAVNDVVSGCKEMFKYYLDNVRAGVSRKLSLAGINSSDVDGLDSIFDDTSNPFVGLETAYFQDKFISQELGCIVC